MGCRGLRLLLTFLLWLPGSAIQALDRPSANSLWIAETGGAIQLASSDGSIQLEIAELTDVRAAGVDVRRETVWLLAAGELAAYDLSGAQRFSVPVAVPRSVHADLVVVPSSGAVWLAAHRDLVNVGAEGQLLGLLELDEKVVALAVDDEESLLWVGLEGIAEMRDSVTGGVIGTISLEGGERLHDLRVDPDGGRLWLAAGDEARLYEGTGELVVSAPLAGLERIAPAPGGAAWLADKKTIARLEADGSLAPALSPFGGQGTIEHLVVSGEGTVWVANQTAIARVSADGSVVDRISFQPPARIWDLATNTDWVAPSLEILAPSEGACLADAKPTIELAYADRGWGVDPGTLELLVDGHATAVLCTTGDDAVTCRPEAALSDGLRQLTFTVDDFAGNSSTSSALMVRIDTVSPVIEVDFPSDGSVVAEPEITIEGSLSESATLTLDGAALSLDGDLRFHHGPLLLPEGTTTLELVARDCAGNTTATTLTVSFHPPDDGLPPDPAEVAPTLDPTVPTELASAVSFLYSGPTPIQAGVAASAIDPRRVVVVRGRVVNRAGEPLPGVRVHAPSHRELGETLTRQDGMFDFVANGGGVLRLDFSKADHLPAQRRVETPWRDFVGLEDVVLVELDDQVTVISAGAGAAQVARGSVVEDEDGSRQATLVFPASTVPYLVMPGGFREPVSSLSVRATEYTVGDSGPLAMPAPLPPTTGYTYAVELSADEALAAGATRVEFDQPIYHYVENFLDFPVGGIVPAGYFDRDLGLWLPSENGRIIQVLSTAGGPAQVDVDGSGSPASAADLAELGFTEGELAHLAAIYQPGQTLWRTPIPHFTPWDCNWPYGPPEDAEEPPEPDPDKEDPDEPEEPEEPEEELEDDDAPQEDEEDPCQQSGSSFIECENQVLGETIPVAGTPFSLTYKSDRVPGRRVSALKKIRLSGSRVPASLKRIELVLQVAGRRFKHVYPPSPRLDHTFLWDGIDAYGRTLQGDQRATARISYVYDARYYSPAEFSRSFGRYAPTTQAIGDRARSEIRLERSFNFLVAHWHVGNLGLGGWTLSPHHIYSATGRTLLLGNGTTQRADLLASSILRRRRLDGDWTKLDVHENGLVFLIDRNLSWDSIQQVDPTNPSSSGTRIVFFGPQNGFRIHSVVAAPAAESPRSDASVIYFSRGGCGTNPSTSPATVYRVVEWESSLTEVEIVLSAPTITCPRDLAFAPDGSLYIADQERILRFVRGQEVEVVADQQRIPNLRANFIAVGDGGSIYFTQLNAHRVWKLDPAGELTIVAGSATSGYSGDGGPGPLARLVTPEDLVLSRDGSLLILDRNNRRIRRLDPDGIIHTIAGNGSLIVPTNGAPALAAGIGQPTGIALSPTGDMGVVIGGDLWEVTPAMPGFSIGEQVVAGADGIHVFSPAGRHLRTHHGLTGVQRFTFAYDPEGRLSELVDGDGNRTRIERNNQDSATIVSPFGERTELAIDEDGYLSSITNAAGESHTFEYGPGGLLTKVTKPERNSSEYTYSPLGRLTGTLDAAGGGKTISRRYRAGAYETQVETELGVVTTYGADRRIRGATRRTVTTPADLEVDTVIRADGHVVTTYPDGTVRDTVVGPDPRFGMAEPVVERQEVTTPSGLTSLLTRARTVNLAQQNDPLSLSVLRDTVTVNGRTSTQEFRSSTSTLTSTSPEGRRRTTVLDAQGRPTSITLPGTEPTSLLYDDAGRVARIAQGTGALERDVTFGYDSRGRLVEILDPLERSTRLEYDEAGRVIRQTFPDERIVSFQYDENGNLTAVVPPGRPPHLFRYTPVDTVEAYEPPELDFGPPATTYSYDLDRRLIELSRPDGKTVNLTYDPAGRPETITHPEGFMNLDYDAETGHLSSITTDEGAISYSYDGSLLTGTTWSGPIQGTVAREYDENFWLRSSSLNGEAVTFDYDDDGLLTRAGELTISRDLANGRVLGTTLGTVETSVSYNPFGDLETIEATSAGGGLYAVTYERDRLGRVAAKTEMIGGLAHHIEYFYDLAGRLERVIRDGAPVEEYRYDANGNRLVAVYPWGELSFVYDDQDRLLVYGETTYTYTAAGDLASRTDAGATTSLEYDVFGNLQRVDLPAGVVLEYVVDGQNRRIGRKENGVLVRAFLYKDGLNPVAELDGAGTVVARFIYGTQSNVPNYMVKNGIIYRLISDHLGTVRLVVDIATGTIAQRLEYDSFGRVTLDTNPGFQPFGFAGGLHEQLTGFVRFGLRDYDPQVGRWTAKDPIGFAEHDPNLYAYVINDPVNWLDPAGLEGKPGGYPTVGLALVDAFNEILSKSPTELQWEWGGVLYEQPDGNFNYTGPESKRNPFYTTFPGGPSNCEDTALYHRHPSNPMAAAPESFSPADIQQATAEGLDSFLLTPTNMVWKFSPPDHIRRIGRFPAGED